MSFLPSSQCKSENCLDRCTYYAGRSKTAVSTGHKYSINYGDSCVDARIYLDDVEFAGIKVPNMPIGGAERMSGFDAGFDGFLGLGPNIQFNKTGKLYAGEGNLQRRQVFMNQPSSFVNAAFQIGQVQSPQFGVFVSTNVTATPVTTPAPAAPAAPATPAAPAAAPASGGFTKRTTSDAPAGYLIVGGVDKSKIDGDFNYLRLADAVEGSTRNWDVCLKKADFGNGLDFQQEEGTIASISTSSSYITMPCHQGKAPSTLASF
jgi:hypothetical protein